MNLNAAMTFQMLHGPYWNLIYLGKAGNGEV